MRAPAPQGMLGEPRQQTPEGRPRGQAGVFCGAGVCYSWGAAHWKITEAALHAIPEWQRAHWRDSEAGFRKYCCYPDMGLSNAAAKPYLVMVNKRLLHYFPRDNREDFLVFNEGAERYVRLIVGRMREGEYAEAAKFGGKAVFASGVLASGAPARKVAVPVAAGGTLEFISEGRPGLNGNEANHAVWGEPVLFRLDGAKAPAATSCRGGSRGATPT